MDAVQQKAAQFVQRLLANPALVEFSPIQKEDQIGQFLRINGPKLFPTLSSPSFFPGQSWAQIQVILTRSLREVINKSLFTQLQRMFDQMDFAFVAFMREQALPVDKAGEAIFSFLKRILRKDEARVAFVGPFMSVKLGMPDRYIDEAFRRRQYIYFELLKVQKLKMSKEEIKHLIKTSLLLRVAIHLVSLDVGGSGTASGIVQKHFAEKVMQLLKKAQIKILPEPVLWSGLNSNISFLENPDMETTSRLASVFSFRCQNYKPIAKVDRGADTPDKSWFNIARRNYKFYGFDIKMLDELYKIAGENGW